MNRHPAGRIASAAAATIASVVLVMPAGVAAPHGAQIVSVTQTECGSLPCTRGAQIHPGAVVSGTLAIKVSAAADLGLEWVRLEAQNPGDPRWYCLEMWDAQRATSLQQTRTWNTARWTDPRPECAPGTCSKCIHNAPHHHGAPTVDLPYTLRVVAREQGKPVSNAPDDESPTFSLKVQTSPVAPKWNSLSAGVNDGKPSVSIEWAPNPEEQAVPPEPAKPPADVREYRFLRIDPAGHRTAYAVSAIHPEKQGCSRITTIAYRCVDTAFPASGYAGTYRYAIAAVRGGFTGTTCQLSSGTCVIGPLNAYKSTTLSGGAAETSPQASASASASPTEEPAGDSNTAPVAVPTEGLAAAPAPGARTPNRVGFFAGGVLLLLGALGATIWLRRRPA